MGCSILVVDFVTMEEACLSMVFEISREKKLIRLNENIQKQVLIVSASQAADVLKCYILVKIFWHDGIDRRVEMSQLDCVQVC